MKRALLKEVLIYLSIFIVLALGVHVNAWVSSPIAHIKALPSSSMGALHPLLLSFGVYAIVALIRGVVKFIKKVIAR